jgi:hypothetical protein
MIYASIALFALAAVLGLTILIKWLSNSDASYAVKFTHGGVAATGLVLLIVYAVQSPEHFPKLSIILFAIAAVGGFYMIIRDLSQKVKSTGFAFVHALLAIAGFITLLVYAFS